MKREDLKNDDLANYNSLRLGTTVKKLREQLGLSQTQLGELASLSAAEISKLESGKRKKVPIETLIRVSPYLNVPIDYLLSSCIPNCKKDKERFYDYNGNELDLYKISRNLYSVDSEFLMMLSTADFLSDKKFINFLKLWVQAKNAIHTPAANIDSLIANIMKSMFSNLIDYCSNILNQIISLHTESLKKQHYDYN